ncbi:hypothetical protein E2C01_081925 [Portunus trituberculatus]|uniref:Uncharacterized protein n=1 Tax=Portunus trituberculatus TaxID=210409 RepID=A0A5B7IX58_PORTR|nr:hypothetical protein [Portunus trituberculatus]
MDGWTSGWERRENNPTSTAAALLTSTREGSDSANVFTFSGRRSGYRSFSLRIDSCSGESSKVSSSR